MFKNMLISIGLMFFVSPLQAVCSTIDEALCLLDRFSISIEWKAGGLQGRGHVAKSESGEWLQTDAAGNMWLFSADNLEFLVKAVDACSFNDHWWLFYAATTNVEFDLTVTDTMTGATNIYRNPKDHAAEPVQDTSSFRCAGHFTFTTKSGVLLSAKIPPVIIDIEAPDFGSLNWTPSGEITYIADRPLGGIDNMWFHRRRFVGGQGNEVEVIEHRRLSILVCDWCNPTLPADVWRRR